MINTIICNDNSLTLKSMQSESIDLIYLDPPFFTQREWELNGNEFTDKWTDMEEYVEYMKIRLIEMHRILKPTGSIYLHLDQKAVFNLKLEMDKIFKLSNFKTMITWRRCHLKPWAKIYSIDADYILFYTKSNKFNFNKQYTPYNETKLAKFKYDDEDGKGPYQLQSISGPIDGSVRKYDLECGESTPIRGYAISKETMLKRIEEGLIVIKPGTVPNHKFYLNSAKGVPLSNIWTDFFNVTGNEILNYPTQKSETLLERIIIHSSNPGDLILDPFCGSGTTPTIAKRLGRNYIGIDLSLTACELTNKRLKEEQVPKISNPTIDYGMLKLFR